MGWALTRRRAMPAPAAIATSGADSGACRPPATARPAGNRSRGDARSATAATGLRPISANSPLRCTCSTGTTASQPRGNMAPVMISMQLEPSGNDSGGSPAACVPATRSRRRFPRRAVVLSAMPSMATRSNGGWSRSAYMFSRSTAPAACVSGNDSIGRHTRCCSMRVSACAGVSTIRFSPRVALGRGDQEVFFSGVLGLPGAQLLVETISHVGHFLDRGVVFLVLFARHLGLLLRRWRRRWRRPWRRIRS